MEQEKIGKLIKELRIKNNLSQKDFANKFGVTYQAVSKWERGINLPDLSILKEICEEYNLSLDEFLNSKNVKKNNKIKIIIGIIITILIILVLLVVFLNNKTGFEFKTIVSNCKDFSVTGSMAYNKDKTSIYISHINYCGEEQEEKYNEIKCTLYEENGNTLIAIDSCTKKEDISLDEFLKSVKFNINNYEASCKKYKDNSLYLEINALNSNNKTITYKVPLNLQDNCN